MLYKILYWINKFLLSFGFEIRKTSAFPHYYMQSFKTPDYTNDNGVYTISIENMISPHFFSYGQESWHYYTACLKEYLGNPGISYDRSVLKKYYDAFQPKSVADILFFDDVDSAPDILKKIPALLIRDFWRLDGSLEELKRSLIDEETQLYGPISGMYGEEQFIRCVNAHRLINKHGYIPERFEDGYIGGYFFKKGQDYKFLAMAGKHRLAALSVLGFQDIKVTCPYNLKILDADKLESWPIIRSGLFTEQEMGLIIDKCFGQSGQNFAQYYHLNISDAGHA